MGERRVAAKVNEGAVVESAGEGEEWE